MKLAGLKLKGRGLCFNIHFYFIFAKFLWPIQNSYHRTITIEIIEKMKINPCLRGDKAHQTEKIKFSII